MSRYTVYPAVRAPPNYNIMLWTQDASFCIIRRHPLQTISGVTQRILMIRSEPTGDRFILIPGVLGVRLSTGLLHYGGLGLSSRRYRGLYLHRRGTRFRYVSGTVYSSLT